MKKTLALFLVVASSMVFAPTTSRGVVVLSNIGEAWANGYGFSASNMIGLGFAAGPSGGTIDALSLSLLYGNSATSTTITYAVSLYALDAGNLPTGSALSLDTGVSATWTGTTPGQFKQQTFSYTAAALPNLFSVSLSGNAKYALVLSQDSGLPAFEHYWAAGLNSNGYASASGFSALGMVSSGDGGANWGYSAFAANPTWSRSFITSMSVTAAPVPEPGTWAAAAMLLGGAGFARWNRREKRASVA